MRGKILTCAVCGVPLRPDNAKRCSECGHIVCKEHIRFHNGKRICVTCMKRKIAREHVIRKKEDLVLELAVIEF